MKLKTIEKAEIIPARIIFHDKDVYLAIHLDYWDELKKRLKR